MAPKLPHGAAMELPGRGTTFVRTMDGPPGAATVLLLHGWTATADLNWFACYHPLAEHYRVVALDHRGHGRGIRTKKGFRLEDCADDAMAVCDVLGLEHVIPIGYSMGGPVAQLVWRRHRERVQGLVLCATSIIVQYGLTHMPANQAIVIFLSELVFAAVSSYFLAGEAMGLKEIIGAVLIVSASLLSGKIYTEPEPSILARETKP